MRGGIADTSGRAKTAVSRDGESLLAGGRGQRQETGPTLHFLGSGKKTEHA